MSKHSHISAIFDNAFQSRAGSPDVYMSMTKSHNPVRVLFWTRNPAKIRTKCRRFAPIKSSFNFKATESIGSTNNARAQYYWIQ